MITDIANELTERYPAPRRYFGCTEDEYGTNEWRRRRLFANIIVGGSKDQNAVDATSEMFSRYAFEYLADRDSYNELRRAIADMLDDEFEIRFPGKKADYILKTAYALNEEHNGIVPDTEKELTAFPGVGRHAAQVFLGLGFNKQTFGVDLHVRRILKRMKVVDKKATDRKIEKFIHEAEIANSALFSRSLVDFGKDICSFRPQCKQCPFQTLGCDKGFK